MFTESEQNVFTANEAKIALKIGIKHNICKKKKKPWFVYIWRAVFISIATLKKIMLGLYLFLYKKSKEAAGTQKTKPLTHTDEG